MIELNSPQNLGELLAEAGVTKIKIVPNIYMASEDTLILHTSYEVAARFEKILKDRGGIYQTLDASSKNTSST